MDPKPKTPTGLDIVDKRKKVRLKTLESEKARIAALLELGETVPEIARILNIPYTTVKMIRADIDKSYESVLITDVKAMHPKILEVAVEEASKIVSPEVAHELGKLKEGVQGMEALDLSFQTTMGHALDAASRKLQDEDIKTAELVSLTNAISRAYSDIFNSKGVSVNVNNGQQFSTDKLSMFKGSLRG